MGSKFRLPAEVAVAEVEEAAKVVVVVKEEEEEAVKEEAETLLSFAAEASGTD